MKAYLGFHKGIRWSPVLTHRMPNHVFIFFPMVKKIFLGMAQCPPPPKNATAYLLHGHSNFCRLRLLLGGSVAQRPRRYKRGGRAGLLRPGHRQQRRTLRPRQWELHSTIRWSILLLDHCPVQRDGETDELMLTSFPCRNSAEPALKGLASPPTIVLQ